MFRLKDKLFSLKKFFSFKRSETDEVPSRTDVDKKTTGFVKKFFTVSAQSLFLSIPFVLMDIFIRILTIDTNYIRPTMILPSFIFSVTWIVFIVSFTNFLPRRAAKIFYGFNFILFLVLFFTHCIYYNYTDFFFCFRLMQSAEEGSEYIWDTIKNANPIIFLTCLFLILIAIYIFKKFPVKNEKANRGGLVRTIIIFMLVLFLNPYLLGKANSSLKWDTWRNPRNVYQNFNDSNKCIKICGLYQYTFRDFYMTFLKFEEEADPEELAFLEQVYKEEIPRGKNDFSDIYRGKNVIFLQLEGIDSWMFNLEDMPNTYKLLRNSINFTNHYSYYNGGGSTFNSELATTTGFLTPMSYSRNPYTFNTNLFENSLPNKLKKEGYSVNAFHMNTGEFYSRELNYQNWGYDNYYSLIDDGGESDLDAQLDTTLIKNSFFYDKLFHQSQPFMHYIITYTPHTPFSLSSPMGEVLAEKKFGSEEKSQLSEEEVARLFATETDDMVGLLLQGLKDNDFYENTVIVAFTDHYLYTLNDKSILDQYKRTDNNLINNTPFFIWSYGSIPFTIDKVNSQLDILPTVLNILGIDYDEQKYIGRDIFDNDYNGYAFFSDYSWYDGKVYVENGEVVEGKNFSQDYIIATNDLINKKIQQNDLTLKYDYFRRMKKSAKK